MNGTKHTVFTNRIYRLDYSINGVEQRARVFGNNLEKVMECFDRAILMAGPLAVGKATISTRALKTDGWNRYLRKEITGEKSINEWERTGMYKDR